MRSFIVSVLLQVALVCYAAGSPSVADVHSENSIGEESNTVGSSRSGRILAAYGSQIQQGVAQGVVMLGKVVTSVQNMSSEIEALTQTLTTSEALVLNQLTNISTALSDGGFLATKLDTIDTTMTSIVGALINPVDNSTIFSQFSALITLLDTKLTNLEKIMGFDNYPTTTAAPTTTTQAAMGRK